MDLEKELQKWLNQKNPYKGEWYVELAYSRAKKEIFEILKQYKEEKKHE
jgi:hypothetical protein